MKNLLFVFVSVFFIAASCSTSTDETVTPDDTSTATIAFEHATMKPLFDKYCASCHASGKSDSRDWLYNPANYTSSIKASIGTLYKEVYTRKSMPEGATLAAAELSAFKAWYDAGYPAK